jgi:hypothetical protein
MPGVGLQRSSEARGFEAQEVETPRVEGQPAPGTFRGLSGPFSVEST